MLEKIKPFIKKGQMIILEVQLTLDAQKIFFVKTLKKSLKLIKEIFLSYSPERENPGDENYDFKNTPK